MHLEDGAPLRRVPVGRAVTGEVRGDCLVRALDPKSLFRADYTEDVTTYAFSLGNE